MRLVDAEQCGVLSLSCMPIPSLPTVNAAIQILTTATKALNAARERAAASNDLEMKAAIGSLYDQMNALKEAVARIKEEDEELRSKIAQLERQAEVNLEPRRVGAAIFYYDRDDKGPYCQVCYDGKDRRPVLLPAAQPWSGGLRRTCAVCGKHFWERPIPRDEEPTTLAPQW